MDKKSFIIFDNWAKLFTELPTEEAGMLIKMLCSYKLGMEVKDENKTVYAIFLMMQETLEEADKIYQEKCEKNKINASKGGKQKAENAKKNIANGSDNVANGSERLANGSECYQTAENAMRNVAKPSITDTDTDNDINNKRENILKEKNVIPPKLEWVKEYCRERNNGVDAEYFYDFYESKNWFVGKTKMKDWQASIRTWERNKKKMPEKKTDHKQTTYDFDELRRMIQ